MFCEKCGNPIRVNERFCSKCGTPVPVQEAPKEEHPKIQIPKVDAGKAADAISNAASAASEGVEALLGKGNEALKKMNADGDKKKTALIAGAAAAVVVVLLVVFNFARINNFVHKQFTSPEKYYRYVERKTVKDIASSGSSIYDSYVLDALNFYDKSVEGELSLELGEAGQELAELAGLAGVDLSWLKGAGITTEFSVKDNTIRWGAGATLNKNSILSGNMIVGLEEGSAYLQIPELTDTYLGVEFDEMLSGYEKEALDEMVETLESSKKMVSALPSQAKAEKLAEKYLNIALKQVDDVSKGKKTIKAEGVQQACTELKVKIDMNTMQKIVVAIAEEARDDKDLKKIIIDFVDSSDSFGMDGDECYEEFLEELDDLLSELDDDRDYGKATVLDMKVYVDSKGVVRGRSISNPWTGDTTVSFMMPQKGSKFGCKMSMKAYRDDVEISGSGKRKGDKITGDFKVKYNGTSLVDVAVKNLNTEDLKKGMPNGTMTVSLASSIGKSGLVSSVIGDIEATISFDTSNNSGKYKISVSRDGDSLGTITASVKTGNGSKASIPSAKNVVMVEDTDDLEDWMEDISWDKFIDRLEKADVPDEWLDTLEDIVDAIESGNPMRLLRYLW